MNKSMTLKQKEKELQRKSMKRKPGSLKRLL